MLKSFIGIGILSTPYAFYMGGYLGGSLGLLLIGLIAYQCMQRLLQTAALYAGLGSHTSLGEGCCF